MVSQQGSEVIENGPRSVSTKMFGSPYICYNFVLYIIMEDNYMRGVCKATNKIAASSTLTFDKSDF